MKVNTPNTPPNEPYPGQPSNVFIWEDETGYWPDDDDLLDDDFDEEPFPEYEPDIEDDTI